MVTNIFLAQYVATIMYIIVVIFLNFVDSVFMEKTPRF